MAVRVAGPKALIGANGGDDGGNDREARQVEDEGGLYFAVSETLGVYHPSLWRCIICFPGQSVELISDTYTLALDGSGSGRDWYEIETTSTGAAT